jgi:hypothetical protein
MARRPNYAFQRNARAKAKAEKREAKRGARLEAKTDGRADTPESESPAEETDPSPGEDAGGQTDGT